LIHAEYDELWTNHDGKKPSYTRLRQELRGNIDLPGIERTQMPSPNLEPSKIQSTEPHSPLAARVVAQFRYRILVVDDESPIRESTRALLENQGYDVLTAADGLDGILALGKSLPDVIISDLHMPRMSGFEFLTIVRQRFPHIATIAMSGEYVLGNHIGVIKADAFWQKGQPSKGLLQEITRVVAASPARPESAKAEVASLFVTRDTEGYLIITCPKCLRPSKIEAVSLNGGVHETVCSSCHTAVKFEINHEITPTPKNSVAS
jgi:CheY-like chemotaxis protein